MGDTGQSGRGFQPVGMKWEFQPYMDSDVHITLDDQQKINHFARCYAKHCDLLAELKAKQSELKNLEDAEEELVLIDEDVQSIPFLQGEVFICLKLSDTNKALEKEKKKMLNEIKELEEMSDELKTVLSNLKTQLYAKFGSQINLED